MNATDIVGKRFGKLLVVAFDGYYEKNGKGRKYHWYRCRCDCGNECLSRRDHLTDERKKSCGRCNKIIPENDYFRYICQNGNSFLFDAEDYEKIAGMYCYVTTLDDGHGYAMYRDRDGKIKQLSRLILELPEGLFVDHVNGDHLDNRRSNLRAARVSDNSRNARIRNDNTSGFKGVSFFKRKERYRAYINFEKKQIHIGYFDTPEEAARAYDTAARFLFGEFACVNFPREGEQGCQRIQESETQIEVA